MMLKVVKHQVIAGQQIKLKVVNYSRLRPRIALLIYILPLAPE